MNRPLSIAFSALSLTLSISAQQAKVLAPHRPAPPKLEHPVKWHDPAVLRSMVGGFWMIDANYKSTIYLKNNVETDAITVTPILYLSNGHRYPLKDLTIEPAGVATLSINAALSSEGIASWATLTGYVELDYTWPWSALCASVEHVDVAHSLIFSSGFRASGPSATNATAHPATSKHQVLEGMWWKQEPSVTGFVALSNTSTQPTRVTVQMSDSQNNAIAGENVTVSPHGTKTVALNELAQSTDSFGGIRVAYDGTDGGLIVNGALEDQSVGYSSAIPFAPETPSSKKPQRQAYAESGLMAGTADPMMSFPAGTTFTPYSILRNISAANITITPTMWWMEHSEAHSKQLPQFQISPNTTEALDVPSLISLAGLKNSNGNITLQFDVLGPAGGLLMAAGSVDQKNTYVFEVRPSAIEESQARSLSYWDTANGDDTMVTVWNPADEAQEFVFRLSFSGGHYKFPLHLGPRGSQTFNISEVINDQIPDDEGNVVPTSVHAGSADLEGTQGDNQDILAAMEAGTYNVVKATCVMRCVTCHGATSFWTQAAPFLVDVSVQKQLNAIVQYDSGSQSDLTTSSSWSSSAGTVASVSSGLVHGVSAGSVNVIATSPTETQAGTDCQEYTPPPCPRTPMQSSDPGTVFDVGAVGPAYIFVGNDPNEIRANEYQVTNAAHNALPQPPGGTCCAASSDPSDAVTPTPNGNNPFTYTIQTPDQSATAGDRTLTFEYDLSPSNGTSVQLQVTARMFFYLTNNNPSNACTLQYGTDQVYDYTVYTHPDNTAVLQNDGLVGTPVNETFDPPLTCFTYKGNGGIQYAGDILDHISSACSAVPLTCSQTTTQSIIIAGQSGGFVVRRNTLQWTSSGVNYTNGGPTQ